MSGGSAVFCVFMFACLYVCLMVVGLCAWSHNTIYGESSIQTQKEREIFHGACIKCIMNRCVCDHCWYKTKNRKHPSLQFTNEDEISIREID